MRSCSTFDSRPAGPTSRRTSSGRRTRRAATLARPGSCGGTGSMGRHPTGTGPSSSTRPSPGRGGAWRRSCRRARSVAGPSLERVRRRGGGRSRSRALRDRAGGAHRRVRCRTGSACRRGTRLRGDDRAARPGRGRAAARARVGRGHAPLGGLDARVLADRGRPDRLPARAAPAGPDRGHRTARAPTRPAPARRARLLHPGHGSGRVAACRRAAVRTCASTTAGTTCTSTPSGPIERPSSNASSRSTERPGPLASMGHDASLMTAIGETLATDVQEPTTTGRRVWPRVLAASILGSALTVGIVAGALLAWDASYEGRVLPGVTVGGVDLSGLDRAAASAALTTAYAGYAEGTIVLRTSEGDVTVPFDAFARRADVDSMVGAALEAGRAGTPVERAVSQLRLAIAPISLEPDLTLDEDALASTVTRSGRAARPLAGRQPDHDRCHRDPSDARPVRPDVRRRDRRSRRARRRAPGRRAGRGHRRGRVDRDRPRARRCGDPRRPDRGHADEHRSHGHARRAALDDPWRDDPVLAAAGRRCGWSRLAGRRRGGDRSLVPQDGHRPPA